MTRPRPSPPAAPSESVRTHVVLPPELVAEVDRLVGPRRRSQFFLEAAAERLARLKLAQSAARAAGSLAEADTPEWESPEAASAWVRATRRGDDERRRAHFPS